MRLFAIAFCTMALAPVAAFAQDLPPGPGADLTVKACQNCHGLDTVTSARNNLDGWRSVVGQMIGNGASLTDEEAETVSNYLANNFGFGPPPPVDAAPPAAPAAPGGAGIEPVAPADAAPPAQTPPAQ